MEPSPKNLKNAVALAYAANAKAPTVVASGKGQVAEQIISVAKEHGIYVHESKELVALLMDIDLDREIPENLYRVVAELLAWLYQIEAAIPPHVKAAREKLQKP